MRTLLCLLLLPSAAVAQGFPPAEAVKRMRLPPGFTVTCVAHEPLNRQPLSISHDARGRLWVLQYLQYPNPAGLKPVKQDQYLRTVWDRVPEPPPHGPKGADRLTILSDPDANGVYTKATDFVSGLNLATGFCVGHGGVYIVQPPYLLFYPDKDDNDRPDTDTPDVLLTGFGMEDTHSYANSLQWGPDGWLYGAHGSTVTAKIKNPAFPTEPPVEFQQGVWRFHPITRRFELFAEGGGNTYGLDFDKFGRCIAGTNHGGVAMLHHHQGGYYVKGFSKHGPLHNPHSYGYFDHVPYTGFKGGHVTCGGIVYQGDTFPAELHDQYIAGNLLSNDVYWHRMSPSLSSFTATHGGDLLTSHDTWHRPVDLMLGPDGSVYVADWYDKRAAHLDPIDNWDKTNGRVYRIDYQGTPRPPAFDLRTRTTAELCELLKHPNAWWRREARRLLAERRDPAAVPLLQKWIAEADGLLPLEALWALYAAGGTTEDDLLRAHAHPNEHIRAWAVRLIADLPGTATPLLLARLTEKAEGETSPTVRAQLACTAKRLGRPHVLPIVQRLLDTPVMTVDPQLPLLMWWAIEATFPAGASEAGLFARENHRNASPMMAPLSERIVRRLLADDVPDPEPTLLEIIGTAANRNPTPVLRGLAAATDGGRVERPSDMLRTAISRIKPITPETDRFRTIVLARYGDPDALADIRQWASDTQQPPADRAKALDTLRHLRDPELKPLLLSLLDAPAEPVRLAAVAGLEGFDDPSLGPLFLKAYPNWPAALRKRAVQALTTRKAWAADLLSAVEAKAIPAADVPAEQVRTLHALNDPTLTARADKLFGKVGPATPGEKQARISWLSIQVGRLKGDPIAGRQLFTQHCSTCHVLHGEGTKLGPDLTTADRRNVRNMLSQIVDPSAVVRPEYVQHTVRTADGRTLSGLVAEATAGTVTLLTAQNQTVTVPQADVEEFKPVVVSLMPEKLLDTLTDQQVADLFAYLRSDPPKR